MLTSHFQSVTTITPTVVRQHQQLYSASATSTLSNQLTFFLFDKANQIPLDTWHSLVPANNILHDIRNLQLLENNQQQDMQFIYAVLQKNNEAVGVAYFQIVRFTGNQLKHYAQQSNPFMAFIQKQILRRIDVTLLVGANLFISGEKGMFWKKGTSKEDAANYYHELVAHIFDKKSFINGFLMTDVYDEDEALSTMFTHNNFHRIYEEPDMVMELKQEWNTYEDYIKSISSKYRVRAKRCFALSNEIERRSLSASELRLLDDELIQLYNNTMNQSAFSLARLKNGYFAAQKEQMPEAYTVFGYLLNGKLVGFNSLFCINGKGEVHYVGLNYEVNKSHHLYQRMLYDMVACGIERKLPLLHFGRTASEIKSTIGAVPVNVHGFVRHKNNLLNKLIIRPLAKAIKPREFIFRNPFKDNS